MPATALNHFQQDILRAKALIAHGDNLLPATPALQMLRADILRAAWMFAVGALDAYFCDAYTDVIAATIISKSRQLTYFPHVADLIWVIFWWSAFLA